VRKKFVQLQKLSSENFVPQLQTGFCNEENDRAKLANRENVDVP